MRLSPGTVLLPRSTCARLAPWLPALAAAMASNGVWPPTRELAEALAEIREEGEVYLRQLGSAVTSRREANEITITAPQPAALACSDAGTSRNTAQAGIEIMDWLSTDDVARQLGVGARAITALAARGRLRGWQDGTRRWRFDPVDVGEYRRARRLAHGSAPVGVSLAEDSNGKEPHGPL